MQISCSNCEYSREIDDAKVPDWAEAVKCPQCGHRIPLGDPPLEFLPSNEPNPHHAVGQAEPSVAPTRVASDAVRPSLSQPPPIPVERRESSETPCETDIPWESRQGGFVRYFVSTIRMVLFRSNRFFENMRSVGGYARPMSFILIMGYVTALITVVFSLGFQEWQRDILNGIQSPVARSAWANLLAPKPYNTFIIILTIFGPLLSPFLLFINAGIMYGFLPLSVKKNAGFQPAYRVAAYTSAASIFSAVPVIGSIVSFFWGIRITIVGLARVYQTSNRIAFWAAIGPFIVYLGLSVIGYEILTSILRG